MGAVASKFDTFGGKPINIAALEGKMCLLKKTMDSNCTNFSLDFWSAMIVFSNGKDLLFPRLVCLLSVLMCLPERCNTATVGTLIQHHKSNKIKIAQFLSYFDG